MKYTGIFKPKISRKFPVVQSPSLTSVTSELVMISRAHGNDNGSRTMNQCCTSFCLTANTRRPLTCSDPDSEGAKLILVCSMIVCLFVFFFKDYYHK